MLQPLPDFYISMVKNGNIFAVENVKHDACFCQNKIPITLFGEADIGKKAQKKATGFTANRSISPIGISFLR
ncbi:MAG: hypothetical protein SOZ80_07840 [Prevotella sp.]|uniref:hypothetical protein n=1 Tax=Prevotella sp. TaxID=59823 RepID=UPI002A262451|nr:hypothetical protein [Prevotella sp.]MDD7317753.1 hypothetical protein [Prevotellaceae bacterium]MDY4020668.1 hypothetical protein [Prevotella sp.]